MANGIQHKRDMKAIVYLAWVTTSQESSASVRRVPIFHHLSFASLLFVLIGVVSRKWVVRRDMWGFQRQGSI